MGGQDGVGEAVDVAVGVAVAVMVAVAVAVDVAVGVGDGLGVTLEGGGTKIVLLVPVIVGLLVSVAVTVWFPGLLSVTTKKPVPLVKVLSSGRFPVLVLVKWTVPV